MKREIRVVNPKNGWIQITTADERWYARRISADGTEENQQWDYVPSVTWIAGHWPKGVEFYKWLATKGWSEAEAIKVMAGDKGSKVHQGVAVLVAGGTVEMDDAFENPTTGEMEPLTPYEYFCLMTFCDWLEVERPEIIASERTGWNEKYRYAGTLDILCRLKSTKYKYVHLIDVKTSKRIFMPMRLQVSALKHSDSSIPKNTKLGILQVGYDLNKKQKFKYTAVADNFSLFLTARRVWAAETAGEKPFQRDYPPSLSAAHLITAVSEVV